MPRCQSLKSILWGHSRARSLLKNYDSLDCERVGCDDQARRPSISVVICKGGATKSARRPATRSFVEVFKKTNRKKTQFKSDNQGRYLKQGGGTFLFCVSKMEVRYL